MKLFVSIIRIEVEKLVGYAMKSSGAVSQRHDLIRRCIISIVWFISSLLIALYVPNIAVVIDVLGALAAMFIFFFPGRRELSSPSYLLTYCNWQYMYTHDQLVYGTENNR